MLSIRHRGNPSVSNSTFEKKKKFIAEKTITEYYKEESKTSKFYIAAIPLQGREAARFERKPWRKNEDGKEGLAALR